MLLNNNELQRFEDFIVNKFPNALLDKKEVKIYSSFLEELDALKNGVGLRITVTPTIIRFVGKESLEFLHRISTNSVIDLMPFSKKRTLFLNEKGRIIARTSLLSFDGEYWLQSDPDLDSRLFSWVNKYIITEDIKTENYSGRYCLVELVGPQADSFLMLLIGDEQKKLQQDQFRRFDVDGFTFYLFQDTENHATKFYKIIIDKNRLVDFINHLDSIKSVFDLSCIGKDAYDYFRIEKGIAAFPNEINGETNPHEVNLIKDICSTKGCYIGQEVVTRLETYDKVQQRIFRVTLNQQVDSGNLPIYNSEGTEIGVLTTICNCNNNLKALALIKKKLISSPNGFHLKIGKGSVSVKISDQEVI